MKTTKMMVRSAVLMVTVLATVLVPAVALARPQTSIGNAASAVSKIDLSIADTAVEPVAQVQHVIEVSDETTIGEPPVAPDPTHETTPGIKVVGTRVPPKRQPRTPDLPFTGGNDMLFVLSGLLLAATGLAMAFVKDPRAHKAG